MKKIFLISILLLDSLLSFSQKYKGFYEGLFVGSVNVYIESFCHTPFGDENISPNGLRVNAKYKISIMDVTVINQLLGNFKLLKKNAILDTTVNFYHCKMVIDFIKENNIVYSLALDERFNFYIDENGMGSSKIKNVYIPDREFICYLKSIFPYFMEGGSICIDCKRYKYSK